MRTSRLRVLLLYLAGLTICHVGIQATQYAPTHFLGTCFTEEWVAGMEQQLGVQATARSNGTGALIHPFLHAALQYPRFTISDSRTANVSAAYDPSCMPVEDAVYGLDAVVGPDSGIIIDRGVIAGSIVVEIHDITAHQIMSLLFAIVASESLGYNVSIYFTPNFIGQSSRMTVSSFCSPTNANVGIPSLAAYSRYDLLTVGSVGNTKKQGVYTTNYLVEDGANETKYTKPFDADFWRDYTRNDDLIEQLAESNLRNNTDYYPPHGMFCPDHVFGCMNQCSKTYACTLREENDNKECLVVVATTFRATYGYWPSLFANLDIPAYFCYIGRDALESFILEMMDNNKGVIFYMNDPDEFLTKHHGSFTRISFPKADPEEIAKNTWQFGENGYGQPNDNPIKVEFYEDVLQKVSSLNLLEDSTNSPAMQLLSRFRVVDLHMVQLLETYVELTNGSSTSEDPVFDSACTWARANYDVWSRWMDPLPLCTLRDHMVYTVSGCNDSVREIEFMWSVADPANASLPYICDGGDMTLPAVLHTSRSCEWIEQREDEWLAWTEQKPSCDPSFFEFEAFECDHRGKRVVSFNWMLPDTDNASLSAECSGGFELPETRHLDCEYMPTSSSGFVVILILVVLLILATLVSMVLVYLKRDVPIVRRSQFEFLETMLLGALCTCAAALAYAGEPTDGLCAARPTLISIGFTLIFGSLVVKSLRVYRVFMSKKLKRVVLPTSTMFKILGSFLLVDTLVLAGWFIADFPHAEAIEYRVNDDALLMKGARLVSRRCSSSSFIFSALLIFWKAILLCSGLYLSFLVRNVSLDFQESIWIFGSSVVVGFGCVLLLPLAYMVSVAAPTFYVFLSVTLWLCTLAIVSMMLGPKLVRHREAVSQTSTTSSTTNGRVVGARGSITNGSLGNSTSETTVQQLPSQSRRTSNTARSYVVKPTAEGIAE